MSEALAEQAKAKNDKIDSLLDKFSTWTPWMQTMEASVIDLNTTAATLRLHAEDTAARLAALESHPIPPAPSSPADVTPLQAASEAARRPDGHGCENTTWGPIREIPGSRRFPPDNGMIVPHYSAHGYSEDEHFERSGNHSRYHSTPKMDFPKFDGTDPMIWKDNCEIYFEIFGISEMMKVKFAMLNFVGNAALWLKTVQSEQYIIHWEDL
jgi:hypothetical protein